MKKLFIVVAMCIASQIFSQSISTRESSEKFSTGNQNAVVTTITENSANDLISEWKKVLKDFKYEKVQENDDEVFGDNVLVKDWGNNPVDIYTKFEEDKKTKIVKMSVAVNMGGAYLTSSTDKDKFNFIVKTTHDFAVKMTKEPITAAVKTAEKQLGKLEDNQKDLEKGNKNLKENVDEYKTKITKAEKDIIERDADIEKKKSEISIQKRVVDASSGAVNDQAKSSKNILEKLEGKLKDLESDKKNLKEDIANYKKKIEKAEKEIKTNEEDQTKKKSEIEAQKRVVDNTQKKLEAVN